MLKAIMLIPLLFFYIYSLDINLNIFQCIKVCNETKILQRVKSLKNIKIKDNEGNSLLHYAVIYKKYRLLKYLVDQNIDIYVLNFQNQTPIDIAIFNEDLYAIKILMHGKNFNIQKESVVKFLSKYEEFNGTIEEYYQDENMLDELEEYNKRVKNFSKKIQNRSILKKDNYLLNESKTKNSKNYGNINIIIE